MKPRRALIVVLAATLGATAAPAQYNPQQERRVALQRTGSSTGYDRARAMRATGATSTATPPGETLSTI